jgi:nucleotide-binding universal stress UspA family protein
MTTRYRHILVHLDATQAMAHRLAAAIAVARQNRAELAALYAVAPRLGDLPYATEIGPSVATDLAALDARRRAQALKVFDQLTRDAGTVVHWSQSDPGAFVQQALYTDLLVLGQHSGDDEAAAAVPPDFVAAVLAASGRPALVMPYVGPARTLGDTIAIAWKPAPETARAVSAALPFLQRARRVHVLAWGEAQQTAVDGTRLDLACWLRAHGVEALWHHGGPEPERVGELMLSRAFDVGADLLVMGCYGHSRTRERILGGATRTLLASMTLPVLMAH